MSSKVSNEGVYDFLRTELAVKQWIETSLDIALKDDLMESLQNGVVLCYLCQAIEERSIPRIQEQTQAAFKLKENVQFVVAALEDMGVPPWRTFLVSDLFEKRNKVAVVLALCELAKVAEKKGFDTSLPDTSDVKDSDLPKPSGSLALSA